MILVILAFTSAQKINSNLLLKTTDVSFPNSQLIIDGYSQPFIYDRNRFGEGALVYIRDDIPCQELSEHKFPIDIEGIFIEINLRKTKWLILGTYRPPNPSIDYFLENVGTLREEKSARIKECGIN